MTTRLRFTRGLHVSDHAVDRYVERVHPAMQWRKAKIELERLVRNEGIIHEGRPEWVHLPPEDAQYDVAPPDAWVEIGDTGILCIIKNRVVVTVVCRSGMSELGRARRNARSAARRAARRESAKFIAWRGDAHPRWR